MFSSATHSKTYWDCKIFMVIFYHPLDTIDDLEQQPSASSAIHWTTDASFSAAICHRTVYQLFTEQGITTLLIWKSKTKFHKRMNKRKLWSLYWNKDLQWREEQSLVFWDAFVKLVSFFTQLLETLLKIAFTFFLSSHIVAKRLKRNGEWSLSPSIFPLTWIRLGTAKISFLRSRSNVVASTRVWSICS